MIPPDANAAFVAAMEDVLETYQKPRDPERPLVCLDETSKQLVIETRKPIPAKPGQPIRYDYEYERNGVANIFMTFAPLEGWRKVKVTDHHAAADYAKVLKELSDVHLPDANPTSPTGGIARGERVGIAEGRVQRSALQGVRVQAALAAVAAVIFGGGCWGSSSFKRCSKSR